MLFSVSKLGWFFLKGKNKACFGGNLHRAGEKIRWHFII